MNKLLVVEASPRGEYSVSRNITRRFLEAWTANHPDGTIVRRDLMETDLQFVNAPWLEAYFTPPEQHSDAMKEALALSDELVAELQAADHLVIGTPVYNYNVPANLKAWVDHIVRKGKTLGFEGEGLLEGKKATVIMASGGIYTEGSPIQDRDIAHTYLRMVLKVIGIEDFTLVTGGGAQAVDMCEQTMEQFVASLRPSIEAAAV